MIRQLALTEESEHFQQFSMPIPLGFVAAEAAALTAADLVLEPSAGTGLLAIFAELAKARLALNEIAGRRAGLLARLFRGLDPAFARGTPSPGTTPSGSTTGSIRQSGRRSFCRRSF